MNKPLRIILFSLVSVLLAGCAPMSQPSRTPSHTTRMTEMQKKQMDEVLSRWGDENKRQNEALGERVYDKDFDVVFSAIVTSFSDIGFAVKNMERQSGYILAEGPCPMPAEQQRELNQAGCDEMNKAANLTGNLRRVPTVGGSTRSVTISLIRLGDHKTKAKMRIAVTSISGNSRSNYYSIYPPKLEAEYKLNWRALEKQIFLNENLDKPVK